MPRLDDSFIDEVPGRSKANSSISTEHAKVNIFNPFSFFTKLRRLGISKLNLHFGNYLNQDTIQPGKIPVLKIETWDGRKIMSVKKKDL